MKKLMMMLAVVAAVSAAEAATMKWKTYSGLKIPARGETSAKTATANNTTVYYFTLDKALSGTPTSTELFNMFFESTGSGESTTWAVKSTLPTGATKGTVSESWSSGTGTLTDGANYGDGESIYAVTIIIDKATQGAVVGDSYIADYGTWTMPIPAAAKTLTMTNLKTDNWTKLEAQSVPEPTSGLLLLLGVAGMALRRRRA